MYTTLQYFLKSYCTLSIHEDEIVSVMEEFIEQEDEEIVLKLRDEFQKAYIKALQKNR
ncbi:hypothetical protein ACT4US_22650 [Bacillus sp. HC-Mk]